MNIKDKQKAATAAAEVATALACPVGIAVAEVALGDDPFTSRLIMGYLVRAALLRLDLPSSGSCVVPAPRLVAALVAQVASNHNGSDEPRIEMLRVPADDDYYAEVDSAALLGAIDASRDAFSPESLAGVLRRSIRSDYDGGRVKAEQEIDDFVAHLFGWKSRITSVVDMTDVQGTA